MTVKIQCSESVSSDGPWGSFHQHPCHKSAVVERDGKHYCKIHDPEYKKAKRDESMKKWQEKWGIESKRRDRLILIGQVFDGVTTEQIGERKAAGLCPCCGAQK
jgi:hypothetical protein